MSTDTGFTEPIPPGEKIRVRFPSYGAVYLIAWGVVAVVLVGGLYQFFSGMPVNALAGKLTGPFFTTGVFAAALIVFYTRWRIVVTDRRVMMRPGFITWKYREIRLDEIEAVGFGGDRLSIRGSGGRELSAKVLALTAMEVAHEIGVSHGLRKVTGGPLEDFLGEGEIVRYQEPRGWEARLLRFRWPIILGAFVATALLNRLVDPPEWADLLFMVPIIFLVSVGMPWRNVPWRLAVTDRRLMVRWNMMAGGPYLEEMDFALIERIRYDKTHRELILDGPDRRIAIPCFKRRAKRILSAMDRDAEGGPP